jgi:hypothetical protein
MLCSLQGWEMAEIVDERPRGNLRCVLDSMLRRCPPIRYDGPHPRHFDIVVLVAPIWVGRLAGPMRSFVADRHALLPDVAVVSLMGGRGAPNAVAEIGQRLGRAPILSAAFTTAEVEDGSCAPRLQAFGQAVQSAQDKKSVMKTSNLSPKPA